MDGSQLQESDLAVDGKNKLLFRIYKFIMTGNRTFLSHADFAKVLPSLHKGVFNEYQIYCNALEHRCKPVFAKSLIHDDPRRLEDYIINWETPSPPSDIDKFIQPLVTWYNSLGKTEEDRQKEAKSKEHELEFNAFLYMLTKVGARVKYLTVDEVNSTSQHDFLNNMGLFVVDGVIWTYPRPLEDQVAFDRSNNEIIIPGQRTVMMQLFGHIGEKLQKRHETLVSIVEEKIKEDIRDIGEPKILTKYLKGGKKYAVSKKRAIKRKSQTKKRA